MFDALARTCRRRPGLLVATWVLFVAAGLATALGGVLGHTLFDRLTSGALVVPGEAQDGLDLLLRTADDSPVVMLVLDGVDPRTSVEAGGLRYRAPEVDAAVDRARADLLAIPGVVRVEDPFAGRPGVFAERDLAFVADDQRGVLVRVTLRRDLPEDRQRELIARVSERLHAVGAEVPWWWPPPASPRRWRARPAARETRSKSSLRYCLVILNAPDPRWLFQVPVTVRLCMARFSIFPSTT
jgi:RND superfamily putative drug exporter